MWCIGRCRSRFLWLGLAIKSEVQPFSSHIVSKEFSWMMCPRFLICLSFGLWTLFPGHAQTGSVFWQSDPTMRANPCLSWKGNSSTFNPWLAQLTLIRSTCKLILHCNGSRRLSDLLTLKLLCLCYDLSGCSIWTGLISPVLWFNWSGEPIWLGKTQVLFLQQKNTPPHHLSIRRDIFPVVHLARCVGFGDESGCEPGWLCGAKDVSSRCRGGEPP